MRAGYKWGDKMSQKLFLLTMGLALFLLSNISSASWDAHGTIDFLEASAEVRIKVGAMNVNPGSCSNGLEYALELNAANFDPVYSLLLSAKIADKAVSIDLNGCSASGYNKVVGARFGE